MGPRHGITLSCGHTRILYWTCLAQPRCTTCLQSMYGCLLLPGPNQLPALRETRVMIYIVRNHEQSLSENGSRILGSPCQEAVRLL